jgi:adenylate cyclase
MGIEIERKFLVNYAKWAEARKQATYTAYKQGYITATPERTVRVRIAGSKGFITIKGKTNGISRAEFEYEIPSDDALALMQLCSGPLVEKIRCKLTFAGKLWEVDEFEGDNQGLILAEIELNSETEQIEFPEWIEQEVTGDKRYYNSYLSRNPFKTWTE